METSPQKSNPRRAGTEDVAAVVRVWLRSRHASTATIPAPIHPDDEVLRWFATVVLPERETWVIEVDGAVAALLVLESGWIDQLYVDPDHTGTGLGSCLLDVAKRAHPAGLDLWTFASNRRARHFYERHGFTPVDATDGDNEEGAPDVRYHWPAR